ncbi:MAG: ABC transporter ATP-binding protein [Betaproteobacteria bacterium]|nr:ABC transporter ATP-binding protein [Betaproteobacteria bacterium]
MDYLKVEALCKSYVPSKPVFEQVNFAIGKGEFVCIIGHSGCGKTTILNVLAGLDDISFAVRSRWPNWKSTELDTHVAQYVNLVGLSDSIDKKPSQLSGGMKQRVGIARAFSIQPKMLLLDEPFGALDALTRGSIQDELMRIVRETKQTVFMITHDVDEAIFLADRILLMSNGSDSPHGYKAGGIAEIVTSTLPADRTRAGLHHIAGYYDLRNHIVDFLMTRARAS